MKILLIIVIIFLNSFSGIFAAEKTLTRIDVIERLSAADFVKKKIGDLLNWSAGYDITKINRTNLAPTISFIKATPIRVPPDNRTVLMLTAKVSDPGGLDNIKGVRADLSSIKKLPNMMLVDNGLWGDTKAADGIYTLQTNVGYDVTSGGKDVPVAVANKMGWVALGKTNLEVELNPVISDAKADPSSVSTNGKEILTLSAKVDNPGRQEDLKEVTIDLSGIGLASNVKMLSRAGNIYTVTTQIKSGLRPGSKKLPVHVSNIYGGKSVGEIELVVE